MIPIRQFVDRELAKTSKNPTLIEIDISRRNEARKQTAPTHSPVYRAAERTSEEEIRRVRVHILP
jgi:hypothetical protein